MSKILDDSILKLNKKINVVIHIKYVINITFKHFNVILFKAEKILAHNPIIAAHYQ